MSQEQEQAIEDTPKVELTEEQPNPLDEAPLPKVEFQPPARQPDPPPLTASSVGTSPESLQSLEAVCKAAPAGSVVVVRTRELQQRALHLLRDRDDVGIRLKPHQKSDVLWRKPQVP